ncbi:MAG: hypothetical protein LC126_18505 [Bryobacterales bacterium]|nr:hypothetical protein [Bryobacterales bacterium]
MSNPASTSHGKHLRKRLGQGTGASASLIASGDRIYAINEDGEVYYVFKVAPTYQELAVNPMNEPVMATPAASGNTLFIRVARHLFAISR